MENLNDLIYEWNQITEQLKPLKAKEAKLRKQITESNLFDPTVESGTERVELGNGWEIKSIKKLNHKVDKDIASVTAVQAKLHEKNPTIANRIFKWSATLNTTEYKQLDDESKALVDTVIEIKPGMPSLELIAPKADD